MLLNLSPALMALNFKEIQLTEQGIYCLVIMPPPQHTNTHALHAFYTLRCFQSFVSQVQF